MFGCNLTDVELGGIIRKGFDQDCSSVLREGFSVHVLIHFFKFKLEGFAGV